MAQGLVEHFDELPWRDVAGRHRSKFVRRAIASDRTQSCFDQQSHILPIRAGSFPMHDSRTFVRLTSFCVRAAKYWLSRMCASFWSGSRDTIKEFIAAGTGSGVD